MSAGIPREKRRIIDAKLHILLAELCFVIALLGVDGADTAEHFARVRRGDVPNGAKAGLVKRSCRDCADAVDAHEVAEAEKRIRLRPAALPIVL